MKSPCGEAVPPGVYRRCLPAAGLSIEANTNHVPADGCYYLLQEDHILYSSSELRAVEERYDRLCAQFWQEQLRHDSPEERSQAALAILQRDPTDPEARHVIRHDGSDADRRRMQEMDRRAAFRNRTTSQRSARAARSKQEPT
ncbi:MAG: hypothetical protein HY320_05825 [Armatimonadetes bacterium]|nr:hypothetical protein [Armatimonadota bacterium]